MTVNEIIKQINLAGYSEIINESDKRLLAGTIQSYLKKEETFLGILPLNFVTKSMPDYPSSLFYCSHGFMNSTELNPVVFHSYFKTNPSSFFVIDVFAIPSWDRFDFSSTIELNNNIVYKLAVGDQVLGFEPI
jgi:hypothetical protein